MGVHLEPVQALAVCGLGRVRVRAGVGEAVAVGRAAAEEAALDLCLAAMAVRTRILIRFRSPLDIPPNTDMTRSWASLAGSIGPPTSGTHSGTP